MSLILFQKIINTEILMFFNKQAPQALQQEYPMVCCTRSYRFYREAKMQSRIMDGPLICHIIANNVNQNGTLFLSKSWNFLSISLKKRTRWSLPSRMKLQATNQPTNPINKQTNKSLSRDRVFLHKTISM